MEKRCSGQMHRKLWLTHNLWHRINISPAATHLIPVIRMLSLSSMPLCSGTHEKNTPFVLSEEVSVTCHPLGDRAVCSCHCIHLQSCGMSNVSHVLFVPARCLWQAGSEITECPLCRGMWTPHSFLLCVVLHCVTVYEWDVNLWISHWGHCNEYTAP